eukprot:COSAG02_NODE_1166_length_14154_cov_19.442191_12_plen_90_part_00
MASKEFRSREVSASKQCPLNTIIKRQLRTKVVQDSFTISPTTKAVLIFLTQESPHLCIENELDKRAKVGASVNALGLTYTSGTDSGKFG